MENPGFGRVFTEHMVVIPYVEAKGGWQRGSLEPYAPISLDPAAMVLHYGQAIFEGFKAYQQPDGGIATFRPEANGRRFQSSARRLAMPELPVELFVESADVLIRQDRDWVPRAVGESLYLRPMMIATEAMLGVRPAKDYLYICFAATTGAYFPSGVKPVTVWISEDYVRAAPGGTGAAKFAGNYAASLVAQAQAADKGCSQVVWIDAVERKYVEELGGMNLFFVFTKNGKTTLVTPELSSGTLLPGVTRESLMQLGRESGYEVVERKLSVDEWERTLRSGEMTEVFACGTAAVITPVGLVKSNRGDWTVNGGETGPVATHLRKTLLDIQHGQVKDTHGWMHKVC
jgi:branched-chain amino acid aminotransferase